MIEFISRHQNNLQVTQFNTTFCSLHLSFYKFIFNENPIHMADEGFFTGKYGKIIKYLLIPKMLAGIKIFNPK